MGFPIKAPLGLAAILAAALPNGAQAETIVQNFSYEASGVQAFDGTLGRLDAVSFSIFALTSGRYDYPEPFQVGSEEGVDARFSLALNLIKDGKAIWGISTYGVNGHQRTRPAGETTFDVDFTKFFEDTGNNLPRDDLFDFDNEEILNRFYGTGYIDLVPKASTLVKWPELYATNYERPGTVTSVFYTGTVTYTYSALTGGVPEPATWLMLVLGFGTLGAAMRRTAATRRPALA